MTNSMTTRSSIYQDGKYQREYITGQRDEKQEENQDEKQDEKLIESLWRDDPEDYELIAARQWIKANMTDSQGQGQDTAPETDPIKSAVNPSHYAEVLPNGLQWIQTIYFKHGEAAYKSACLIMADKYLFRVGRKDDAVQETKKARWYLKAYELVCAGKFHEDGRPMIPPDVGYE